MTRRLRELSKASAVLAALIVALPALASDPTMPRILVTQAPIGRESADLPAGSRIVLLDPATTPKGVEVLTSGFATAGRPSVSVDGLRFLFVARRAAPEPLSVWEMELSSRATRRVVGCEGDCAGAIYGSLLYTIDEGDPAPVIVVSAAAGRGRAASGSFLFTVREDGTGAHRITYDPFGATHPLLLRDGRIVFTSGTRGSAGPSAALLTVFPDGTDVFPFTATPEPAPFPSMACESAQGEVLFVQSDPRDRRGGGTLVAVPVTRSRAEPRVVGAPSGGCFHSPSPLPDGRLLVAWRRAGSGTYGVYRLDPRADAKLEPLLDAPDRDDLDPVAVVPRDRPSGRSSALKDRVPHGELYCLDARRSGDVVDAPSPVAQIDVYRGPEGSSGEILLARVPVEADGSFHLRVPAKTPLRLETVDADGKVIRAMRRFTWVMPNERRGCIGCHEDRDLAPPNRHVLALRRPPRLVGLPPVDRGEPR